MRFFKLPDLGEGLQEAEIVEWLIQPGDTVTVDQALLVVETAKAMVEIPSPQAGIIARCFGQPGDFIYLNEPLVEYSDQEDEDSGTVVGDISNDLQSAEDEDFFIIGAADAALTPHRTRVQSADTLRSARRSMAKTIGQARAHSCCVTLFDDADVEHWPQSPDISVRLCRAIVAAVARQPILNSWFDDEQLSLTTHQHIDLALAVNTTHGLFAPVLRNIEGRDENSLRAGLDNLRKDVISRSIPLQELQGATLTLSNFGTLSHTLELPFCGRYATPLIIPPSVAIIGAGNIRRQPVATENSVEVHRLLPLSLTFDHRVITGAEAATFMGALISNLMQ